MVRRGADRLAGEQREAPVAVAGAVAVGGARHELRLRLERRPGPSAPRRTCIPSALGDLVVLGDAAVGRPRLLEHDHVGLEGRAGADDVERREAVALRRRGPSAR